MSNITTINLEGEKRLLADYGVRTYRSAKRCPRCRNRNTRRQPKTDLCMHCVGMEIRAAAIVEAAGRRLAVELGWVTYREVESRSGPAVGAPLAQSARKPSERHIDGEAPVLRAKGKEQS